MALALIGCGPHIRAPGPAVQTPTLTDTAVIAGDGAHLPLRRWAAPTPRGVILALHGFNDYGLFIEEPAAALAAAGYHVYALDQRGFGGAPNRGRWAGTAGYIADLRATIALLRQRHPDLPLTLLGESMGAAIMLVANAETPLPVEGLVLSAPAVWGRSVMGPMQRGALWLFARILPWFELTGEGTGRTPSDNIEMLRRLGRDPLVIKSTRIDAIHGLVDLMDAALASAPKQPALPPMLILYGRREDIVPPRAVCEFLTALPRTDARRLALYPQGYHMLLRDRAAAIPIADVVAWLNDARRPLPSGLEAEPTGDAVCAP
ncbi:MAG: alpha/beta hydrolase [Alphaproteobacteria bacterium]|nr:alpha/beta hydrolase [Alphaproteobacteria bacterium]